MPPAVWQRDKSLSAEAKKALAEKVKAVAPMERVAQREILMKFWCARHLPAPPFSLRGAPPFPYLGTLTPNTLAPALAPTLTLTLTLTLTGTSGSGRGPRPWP